MKVLIKNPRLSKAVRVLALLGILSGTHANLALHTWHKGYEVGFTAGFAEGVFALAEILGLITVTRPDNASK